MTDERPVLAEQRDSVLIVTLNRPARLNALTDEMRAELQRLLREARADAAVRAVVLTGAGRAFCSGAELGGPAPADGQAGEGRATRPVPRAPRYSWFEEFHNVPVPVVAAVNGVAAGAGLGLALACDVRVLDRGATLYAAFVHRGLAADSGVSWMLTRLVGPAKALRYLWNGERITAEEALGAGLADHLADEGEALPEALRLADRWAQGPTLALGAIKQQVYHALEAPFAHQLLLEDYLQQRTSQTEDAREGIASFRERREPHFRGR